jgi:hypothetical protein
MEPRDVNDLRNITYFQMQLLQAQIEMQAMIAENQHRISIGESIAYGEEAFNSLIEKHGVHHNSFVTQMNEGRY